MSTEQKLGLAETIALIMSDIDTMGQASNTIRDKGQSIIIGILWIVSEGHFGKLPPILDAFENSVKKLKLEREGFAKFVYDHVPVRKDKNDEWQAVQAPARKSMIKSRKKFREEYANDYWVWLNSIDGVKTIKADVDYLARVGSAIKRAEDKGGKTQQEILLYILKEEGIEVGNILEVLQAQTISQEVEAVA